MHSIKAQSAIEYLMTYGWMLLVVAIVGGTIFSVVGEQNIDSVSGFDSSNVNVQDFGVSRENGLMFSLSDPVGETVVQEVRVSGSDGVNVSYLLDQDVSEENLVNLPGINPSDDGSELEVEVLYDTESLENISTTGTVTGNLEVDQSFDNRTMVLDGLVGYWPLSQKYSDGGTVFDLSSSNNHGSIAGDPEFVSGVVGGQALQFDGEDDYIDLGSSKGLPENNSVRSISAWIYPRSVDDSYNHVFHYGDDSTNNAFGLTIRGNSGVSEHTWGSPRNSIGSVSLSQWSYVVITYHKSNNTKKYYLDSELIGSITDQEKPETVISRNPKIGSRVKSAELWEGELKDISVYNRALYEDEIQTIYEPGLRQ